MEKAIEIFGNLGVPCGILVIIGVAHWKALTYLGREFGPLVRDWLSKQILLMDRLAQLPRDIAEAKCRLPAEGLCSLERALKELHEKVIDGQVE
jgi:hypothetical protein